MASSARSPLLADEDTEKAKKDDVTIEWTPSLIIVIISGFVLAFDFGAIYISIQSFWHLLAPHKASLFGLAFGIYDLGQMALSPAMGWLSNKLGFKKTYVLLMALNITGNIMYGMALFVGPTHSTDGKDVGSWKLLMLGRCVAGIGSVGIGLGLVYIGRMTTTEQRAKVAGTFRMSQTLARMLGPSVGIPLLSLGYSTDTDVQRLFNFYTIPAWAAAFFSLCVMIAFIVVFKEPTTHELAQIGGHSDREFRWRESPQLVRHIASHLVVHFVSTFALMIVYSQIFAFAIGSFHLFDQAWDMWQLFVGMGGGAYVFLFVWKRGLARGVQDYQFVSLGLLVRCLAFVCLVQWTSTPPAALFFIATGLLIGSSILYGSMVESFWTKKLTEHAEEAGRQHNLLTMLLPCVGAAARFLGPTFSSAVLVLKTRIPQSILDSKEASQEFFVTLRRTEKWDDWITANPRENAELCFLGYPDHFFEEGCSLPGTTIAVLLMAAATAACLVFWRFWYLPKHGLAKRAKQRLEREVQF